MKLGDDNKVYIRSMGKALRITAIFQTNAEANAHMEKTDDAVIACIGPLILLANRFDRGVKIED